MNNIYNNMIIAHIKVPKGVNDHDVSTGDGNNRRMNMVQ